MSSNRDGKYEQHPSYGLLSISRVQSTGRRLFESPFRHQHFITLSITRAARKRTDLLDNQVMPGEEIVEVAMSEVQFASAITALNVGFGTPCTIHHLNGKSVEEPRADQTKQTFEKEGEEHFTDLAAMAKELEGLTRLKASDVKAPLRDRMNFLALKLHQGLTCNREFFHKQFQETMDRVTAAAKAEIQAHCANVVRQAGLKALSSGEMPFLIESGTDGESHSDTKKG
jgi:hypothetical protein